MSLFCELDHYMISLYVPNKDYNWREDNSQYTRYECDKDGQDYFFKKFKDYLLKDEPALIKKYSVK